MEETLEKLIEAKRLLDEAEKVLQTISVSETPEVFDLLQNLPVKIKEQQEMLRKKKVAFFPRLVSITCALHAALNESGEWMAQCEFSMPYRKVRVSALNVTNNLGQALSHAEFANLAFDWHRCPEHMYSMVFGKVMTHYRSLMTRMENRSQQISLSTTTLQALVQEVQDLEKTLLALNEA